MFDHFEPVPTIKCPACGAELINWQGKDACCNQLLWRQGNIAPVDQIVDKVWKCSAEQLANERLPSEFEIYTSCSCRRWIQAKCKCKNSIWTETHLETDKADDS